MTVAIARVGGSTYGFNLSEPVAVSVYEGHSKNVKDVKDLINIRWINKEKCGEEVGQPRVVEQVGRAEG